MITLNAWARRGTIDSDMGKVLEEVGEMDREDSRQSITNFGLGLYAIGGVQGSILRPF